MRHVKIYRNKIPAEVLVTHFNDLTKREETNHYCFRSNKSKSLLICYKKNGRDIHIKYFFMSFVLSNKHIPMKLENFLKLKAFL